MHDWIKSRFIELIGNIQNPKYPLVELNEICEFIKDGTHQTPIYTEDRVNGFKFLSSKDVTSQKINWTNIKYIQKELHEQLYAKLSPKRGDILLAKNGTTGVAAVVDSDEIFDIYVSLALLRPKSGVNVSYLCSALNSEDLKRQFNSSLKGIGVPNLHLREIKKARIIFPPIDIQNKISSITKQIDKSKFLLQQILEKFELLKKSRFIEMFKNSETLRLDQIAEVTMGQSPDSSSYNSVGKGIPFYQGKTEFTDKYIGQPSTWCTSPTRIAKENDILMSVRAPVGNVNIATEECCIGRGLSSIRPQNGFNSEFIFEALEQKKEELENKATGSTFKAINKDIVLSIQIPNTSISIQKEYSNFVKQIDKSKFNVFQDQTASQVKVIVVLHHIC